MEARNRKISDWYGNIKRGEIKLPRFQRFEAWDRHRISSLVQTVIRNLPLGITLILEVNDDEKFVSRFLQTAPESDGRVHEHLLDGQQRLTALWRVLHNNYDDETYYIYVEEFDHYDKDEERDDLTVYFRTRYFKKSPDRYPLWCDDPAKCLNRGFIPTQLLRPKDIQSEIDDWIDEATASLEPTDGGTEEIKAYFDFKKKVSDKIKDIRSIVANYNLPYLALPGSTDKAVALDVFINMNTNSKPLTQYEIIVAEIESALGRSLHKLQDGLAQRYPAVERYSDLSSLILTTSALMQGHTPNQKGVWDMDKQVMVDKWDLLEKSLNQMATLLEQEGIYDQQRLPTNAVLAVIAALYSDIPEAGDKRGKDELLLRKYMWRAFFTNRYENSAATNAFSDFNALKSAISIHGKDSDESELEAKVPIFNEHDIVEVEELLTAEWPKRATIRGRAILAVLCRLGALDFSTGGKLDHSNIHIRHYHHVYPDALLKEAEIPSFLALNCSLITDKTNISIGRKDPLVYLKDRFEWTSEAVVRERLQSHLIPIQELANGGYEGLSDEAKATKLASDFEQFLSKRADLVMKAVGHLTSGKQFSASDVFVD